MKKYLFSFLLALSSGDAWAIACDRSGAIDLYQKSLKEANISTKIRLLEQASKDCPATYEIVATLGDAQMDAGRYQAAHLTYTNLSQLNNTRDQLAFAWLRLMHSAKALNLYADMSAYGRQIHMLKQQGYTWDADYERLYLELYQFARQKLTENPSLLTSTTTKGLSTKSFVVQAAQAINVDIDIGFEYNSEIPNAAGAQALSRVAKLLKQNQDSIKKVEVIGHTDSKGSDEYNQKLSERRARYIVKQLTESVPALKGKLQAIGRGESEPISRGQTESDHALNRRVSFVIH